MGRPASRPLDRVRHTKGQALLIDLRRSARDARATPWFEARIVHTLPRSGPGERASPTRSSARDRSRETLRVPSTRRGYPKEGQIPPTDGARERVFLNRPGGGSVPAPRRGCDQRVWPGRVWRITVRAVRHGGGLALRLPRAGEDRGELPRHAPPRSTETDLGPLLGAPKGISQPYGVP